MKEKVLAFLLGHKKLLALAGVLVLLVAGTAAWLNAPPEVPDRPPVIPSQPAEPDPSSPPEDSKTDPPMTEDPTPPRQLVRKEDFYTFVIAATNDGYNTDTILVGSIDAKNDQVRMMSVPRDAMVDRDVKYRKINNAYGRKGVEELRLELEELTGVYPDYYGILNLKAFEKIVDQVGGVQFYVPYDMYHEDGITTIDLKQGWQTLDGDKALQLVRFRGTKANDFGRTQVQRDFIVALLKQVKENLSLSTVTTVVEEVIGNVKTNMPVKDILWFYTNVVAEMDLSADLVMTTAPIQGTGRYLGQDYVYLDPQGVVDTVNQGINPYTEKLIVEDLHIVNLKDEDY